MKFKVWDKDKKVMHQGDKICRIHLTDGIPYAVLLWNDEALFHFVLHLGNYSWDSAKRKKTNKKGGEEKCSIGIKKKKRFAGKAKKAGGF